jgi:nucleobase:cation symporter-1, NCS1 family
MAMEGPGSIRGLDAVEARSIDWIPPAERRGEPWQQGPFWFLASLQPVTAALGVM